MKVILPPSANLVIYLSRTRVNSSYKAKCDSRTVPRRICKTSPTRFVTYSCCLPYTTDHYSQFILRRSCFKLQIGYVSSVHGLVFLQHIPPFMCPGGRLRVLPQTVITVAKLLQDFGLCDNVLCPNNTYRLFISGTLFSALAVIRHLTAGSDTVGLLPQVLVLSIIL